MKAKFEFNLPEEGKDFRTYAKANDLLSAIYEFQNYLRQQEKYMDSPDGIEAIRKMFHDTLVENGIDLDELI